MEFSTKPTPGYPTTIDVFAHLFYHFKDDVVTTQCYDDSRAFIGDLAQNINNGVIVEIGVLGGATLLHLYESAKHNNNILYGIDPFETINIFNGETLEQTDADTAAKAKYVYENNRLHLEYIIAKYSLHDHINLWRMTSNEAVLSFSDKSIDLLHIDGDHSTEAVYNDLVKYWPKMKPNGVIVGDDVTWKSVMDGVDRFCHETGLTYTKFSDKFIIKL